MAEPAVDYVDIFAANYSVTGIRRDGGEGLPVVITGSYEEDGSRAPQPLLYRGPLTPTDAGGYVFLVPNFPGQTVTSGVFYGPNTALFDPLLGAGNIRAVGSYKYSDGGAYDHGMIYQGGLDGAGTWTPITVPDDVAGGTVANTIAHSTMGDLVVGNYDLVGQPGSGNGFIFNLRTGHCAVLDIGPLATLYGVWQNGDGASYTLAGGYRAGHSVNQGFLADYEGAGTVHRLTAYSGFNIPGVFTHFEGITGIANGYMLAATTDHGAAFARVDRHTDGSFGPARWLAVRNPETAGISTGNSILDNHLIGIYQPTGGGIQSYVATITGEWVEGA